MTRGRKKDLTIPPSRALAHQRDYRARKAQYIADLEERCRRAEQENAELRKQLEIATAGFPSESAIGVCSAETVGFMLFLKVVLILSSVSHLTRRPNSPPSSCSI
jgi:hypothetical protein